jgi:hypothetical protein
VQSLLQYLTDLERDAPAISQAAQMEHQSQLAFHRAVHETQLEMFKSVIESGQTAINTAILVSGGGTAALLAFVGALYRREPPVSVPHALVTALVIFAFGVLCGAVAGGLRYASQYCYGRNWLRSAVTFHALCVLSVVAAYVLFAGGVVAAYHGFIQ